MMRSLLWIVGVLLVISGCGRNSGQSSYVRHLNTGQENGVRVQQTMPQQVQPLTNAEVENHLERLASSLPNVVSAQCVIFGNTAVVGINVDPKLERSRVDTIKYSVAEALRKDPYGVNAIVTADMDLDERIRRIRDEVKNGRAISGFADEMGKIIGRIVPQLPRDAKSGNTGPQGTPGNGPGAGVDTQAGSL